MGMRNLDSASQPGGAIPDAGCEGLCLHLDEAQIKALGLDQHLPAEGATVSIRATATVRRAAPEPDAPVPEAPEPDADAQGAQAEGAEENAEASGTALELHITKMDVTRSGREPASVLYGGRQG